MCTGVAQVRGGGEVKGVVACTGSTTEKGVRNSALC